MSEENEESEVEVITLVDDEGVEQDFAFLTLVELDGASYAVLAPVSQLEANEPNLDLYAFTYTEVDDGAQLDAVEDEDLLDRIFEVAEEALFDDEEDDVDEE